MIDYEQIINDFMLEKGKTSSVEQGRRFLEILLLKLFDRTETDLENNSLLDGVLFPDGAKDYGIDAAFVDGDILYLLQGKYREKHNYTNVYSFIERLTDFFDLKDAKNIREILVDIFNSLYDDEINEVRIYYITNNHIEEEYKEYSYKTKCEDFNEKYSKKLEKNVVLQVVGFEKYSSIRTGMLLELPKEVKKATSKLNLARFFENRDKTTIVAEVPLKELAKLVVAHKNYIFSSNIRDFKGYNAINKGIKNTYETHPKNFWYFNNGITIVCSEYEIVHDSLVKIKAPQIVNGCQTATTIYNCWNTSSPYDKENIDGTILVKIIQDANYKKRNDITKYTNSQTAVTGKDFFALDVFHTELKKNFKDLGYFYEIQSNSSKWLTAKYPGNIKYNHLFDRKFLNRNAVSAKEITQTYVAALLKMPAKAKNIGEFMPGHERYEKVFNDKTPINPLFYLLPYAVWYYFKNVYVLPENNIIDKDKWKTSLLYITYIFFNIIDQKYNANNYDHLSVDFINLCDEKITNKDEFDNLVKITFEVMRDFYSDFMIQNTIKDNLPRFLKSTIENNSTVQDILLFKIKSRI